MPKETMLSHPINGSHDDLRLAVLDGWRGISILLVLAAHLLPLGPKQWRINEASGAMGMALFFALSGFLITRILLENQNVHNFLIKRFLRIVPLTWLAMVLALLSTQSVASTYIGHLLFYANLPPIQLTSITSHFWSLCVEAQFYVFIALLVKTFGRSGLYSIPIFCIFVTIYRIWIGSYIDIVTIRRVDEILVGATLALIYTNELGIKSKRFIENLNPYFLLGLLMVSSSPYGMWLNYLRPYFAALLIGSTLLRKDSNTTRILSNPILAYIAAISFALYVIHGVLRESWLGTGDTLEKYLKRPILLGVTFGLSHLSTFYFESRFIRLGKQLTTKNNLFFKR